MKKDKTRMPPLPIESEQLATLRTKQERHERLSREHAASAKRVWLRRVLLEVDQERPKENTGARKKAGRQGHAAT
ncbi:MAG: hypothetical protein JRS35_08005 [Deltaproteobacteria bacterium]|nr:hypothetical protein [Deltaproteobacteria bacterium]